MHRSPETPDSQINYDPSLEPAMPPLEAAPGQAPDVVSWVEPAVVEASAGEEPGRFGRMMAAGSDRIREAASSVFDAGREAWDGPAGERVREVARNVGVAALYGAAEGSGLVKRDPDGSLAANRVQLARAAVGVALNPKETGLRLARGAAEGARDAARTTARQEVRSAARDAWGTYAGQR